MSSLGRAALAIAVSFLATAAYAATYTPAVDGTSVERGRYLVKIGSCNDCHTRGFAAAAGKVAEKEWLRGDSLGWRGPWGTTYAANLRMVLNSLSEHDWIKLAQSAHFRPPMPSYALQSMKIDDLRDLHRFVKHLGPSGTQSPAFLPPNEEPKGPYVLFPSSNDLVQRGQRR